MISSPLRSAVACALLLGACTGPGALAAAPCPPTNPATDWDYTDPRNWQPSGDAPQSRIRLVENVHLTPEVESLISGHTTTEPMGDIDYTLRRFPNHHRALWAASRALRKYARDGNPAAQKFPTAECYFTRAIRFAPKDATIYMLYGGHLHATGRREDALGMYEYAVRAGLDSAELHYNYGLALAEAQRFEEALQHAQQAYSKGFRAQKLKNVLKAAGFEVDLASVAPGSAAPDTGGDGRQGSSEKPDRASR